MAKTLLSIAAIGGLLSVALGAFGAHILETLLTSRQLATYETATFYLTVHSLALLMIALLQLQRPSPWIKASGWMMVTGTSLFSGSLYLLIATGYSFIAMATPIGGTALLLGWLLLAVGALKLPTPPQ